MIEAPDWIWLHVPKCAGSTTEQILHSAFSERPGVRFDLVSKGAPVIWHDSIETRQRRDRNFVAGGRPVIGNIRRLPTWLLSRIHFEIQRRGARATPMREHLLSGRYRVYDRGIHSPGSMSSADQMLSGYASEVTTWIRSESLHEDLSRVFNLPADHPAFSVENRNEGRLDYVKRLDFWFTARELKALYRACPRWAAVERQVYGDILRL